MERKEQREHYSHKAEWPEFSAWYKGKCDFCGRKNVQVCGLGEDLFYCKRCWYDELELCDECGELMDPTAVQFYDDGNRRVCMFCAENLGLVD